MFKNLLFICIISLLFKCSLFAQTNTADSLTKVLSAHVQEDSVRVDLLNNLAYEYRRAKPEKTDSLLKISLALSDKIKYAKGKAYALAQVGSRWYLLLKYKQADSVFVISKNLLQSVNAPGYEAYLYRSWANMRMDEGNYAVSLDFFLKGLKKAQDANDVKQQVEMERTIGYLYNILGDYEKAIPYQTDALRHAESINYKLGMSGAYNAIGKTYKTQGNYPASLEGYTKGLYIDEQIKDSNSIYVDYGNIADVYERMGNYPQAFSHIKVYMDYLWGSHRLEDRVSWGEWVLGKTYTHSGDAVNGLAHAKISYEQATKVGWKLYMKEITELIAESAAKLKKWDTAYKYEVLSAKFKDSLTGQEIARKTTMLQAGFELDKKQAEIALLTKDKQLQIEENRREKIFLFALLGGLTTLIVFAVILYRNNRHKQKANLLLQKQKEEIDSKAKELAIQKENLEQSYSNVELLGEIGRKITSSLSVEKIIATVYDNVNALMDASVFGIGIYNDAFKRIDFPATYESGQALPFYSNDVSDQNRFAVQCFTNGAEIIIGDLSTEYLQYLQQMPTPSKGDQPVSLIYLPLRIKDRILGVITVQSFKKNAYTEYELFMLRNIKIYTAIALENAEAFQQLNQTLQSLKQTQGQLIQAEKMASLGELTAGIAHEIQNPLNFVNNFSEVNNEIIAEAAAEIDQGNYSELKNILNDIKDNSEKINYHGKRAADIVKGMLLHSRSNTGQKEATDINALCDEYLRLAYHGLRAKDKTFNAKFETDFDNTIEKINTVPQDMGRVILNLINNAFYSVSNKNAIASSAGQPYEPTVTIATKKMGNKVEIKVTDNGKGIPEAIKEKIFQPFFTTKSAGEGPGLGLSMSYDIVTKGHGGELKVNTKEGEGAEFIIILPL